LLYFWIVSPKASATARSSFYGADRSGGEESGAQSLRTAATLPLPRDQQTCTTAGRQAKKERAQGPLFLRYNPLVLIFTQN